jgi:hypothetical protein
MVLQNLSGKSSRPPFEESLEPTTQIDVPEIEICLNRSHLPISFLVYYLDVGIGGFQLSDFRDESTDSAEVFAVGYAMRSAEMRFF